MSDKQQPAQQNKPKAQAQKPKQQAKPKPLMPLEVAPVEQVWEAPIPAPTLLRQALSNPAQVTPDVLRSLQRTMGNEFTGQFARTNVPEALHRVQTLAHSRTSQHELQGDAAATDDPLTDFSTHPLAASMGLVPPVATTVQRAADPLAGQDVQGNVEGEIEKKRGSGQPIPADTRGHMEGVMGTDFSGVRVHTDSHSDTLSQSLNAKAFTTGSDIFFSQGTYSPHSQAGQKLLAHELTHVVQQGASPTKPTQGQRQEEDEESGPEGQKQTDQNEAAPTEAEGTTKEQNKEGDNKAADSTSTAQRKTDGAAATPASPKPTEANAEPRRRVIQPKLRVNHPDDRYEREADAMAEQAIRPPAPSQGSMAPPEKVGPQKEATRLNPGQPATGSQAGENAAARQTRSVSPAPTFARQFQRLAQTKPAPEGRKSRVIQPKARPTQSDDQDEQEDPSLDPPAHLSAPPTPQKKAVSREPLAASENPPAASGQPPTALNTQHSALSTQHFLSMPRLIARKPRTPGMAHFQKHISRSLSQGLGGGKPKPGHIGATIQRTTDEAIAMAHEHNESQAHGEIQREIAHEQQGGQTLPDTNRQELEGTFHADLRGVRVHTDANADTLARSLDAKAFTTGADIFFGRGEYNPGSDSGKRLLAHEVTHVMQQGAAARQTHSAPPTPPRTIQPKLRTNHPDDKFEQEADAAADLATRKHANSPTRPIQREDDKATLVAPGGQVTETNQTSGGGDNSPAKAKVSEQTDNGKAKGAAEGASKGAQSDTKKTGDKAKGEAKQGEAAARGDQGKTGGAGNSQTSDTLALPQETMANMQQLPPTVQDASGTEAKLGNAATAALEVPDVTPEAVLPNWSDLAAGTVQLAKKDDKKKQEEQKKELVGGAKKKNAGKKEAKPKEVKSDKKEPKAADAAAKNADKAAESAGGGEGGGAAKGGGEQKVAEVPPPEPAPQLPPLPEVPHPSEQGGVQPVGSFPSIDAQGVSEEIAWMQSPHLAKISEVVSSGLLTEKVQAAQKKPPAPKGGEGKAQRKAAATPGLIQRTPSGLLTPGTPLGYERNDSGLYLPSSEPITTPTLPNTVGGLTTGLNSGFVSRTMGNSFIQRTPFSLTGLAGDISQQAVGAANQQFVQRQTGGEVDEMGMFGFLGPELAGLLAGGGIQSLLSAGPGMDLNAAMQQAGGGGFAEGMLSSGGALDVLGSVGQNMGNTANMLPAPNPGFINAAAQQFSPVNWFDQTVGGVGDSASAVAGSFASISAEGTVWGKIAATMESLGTVIDLISQILDIISIVLTVVDVLCTVMIALAPITIVVVLVPIFPFIWTPAVFSPIKAGVATASRILDTIGNVLGTVSQVLLYGATIFRFLDMIETLADPKPSEERQAKLDQHVAQFTQQTMDAFSPSLQDEVSQSQANRDNKATGQLERMKQRRQGKANAGAPPPEPPDGLPSLPIEAAPDTFSDYGDQSGELAATEQALQMQQEEISQMMELGQAGIESIQSSREQTKANRKGVEGHKKDMNKKVGEQKKMKAKTSGGKGKMGAGKAGGGKGKALMKVVMPMIMPLLSFAMTWGAGGGANTGGAKDGADKQATQMSGFFSATNIADVLSVQRIMQTTMLIAQAGKSDEQLGGLDSFLGEKFDAGQQGLGLLQQDGALIAEQLALVQQDRQAMTNQQNQSAGMMGSWMQSSQMARQQMFMQLEQSLGVISGGQEQ